MIVQTNFIIGAVLLFFGFCLLIVIAVKESYDQGYAEGLTDSYHIIKHIARKEGKIIEIRTGRCANERNEQRKEQEKETQD